MAKLGDVCNFYSGTGFPNAYQGDKHGKYPFYKVGDISKNVISGNVELISCDNYINDDVVNLIKGTIIPPQCVVFAKIGEALKLNRRALTSCYCLVDNNVMGVQANNLYLDSRYFYYFMCNVDLQRYSESTAVPSVRKSRIAEIEIPLPSLEEQRHIAAILDKVTDLIAQRRAQLDKLDLLVKSRFVEMFGDPGIHKKGENLIPLGSVCQINPKKGKDQRLISGLKVSFVPMPAVTETGEIDVSETKMYDEVKTGFTYFSENDVLFAKITPCMENGKGAIAKGLCNGIGFGSTEFHVLRPISGKTNPYWIYTLTSFANFRRDAASNMTGSAGQRRVPASFLENYKVFLPPIEEQNQFELFAKQCNSARTGIKRSLQVAELLKSSLMQQYFS